MALSILIVDDETLSRCYIRNMALAFDPGFKLFEASSAKEALQLLEEAPVDILFLDIKMRGTDGFGLLEQLPQRTFEVIFITAYSQYAINAIREGAADYLLKPIKKTEFIASLTRVVNRCREKQATAGRNDLNLSRLKEAENKLAEYLENIKEQGKKIGELNAEIEQLLVRSGDTGTQKRMLDQLQKNAILTDEDWFRFKKIFDAVFPDFFQNLRNDFTELTQGEVRLLALTKLGIQTKEMAGMLGVSPETIRQTRWRLRKKINLPEDISLEEIVSNI